MAFSLRRYALISVAIAGAILVTFAIVDALGIPILTDPRAVLGRGGAPAAVVGVGLLVGDVVLPVPSSVVMLAHGALFGAVAGTALSLVGSIGAAALGFAIGRRGAGLIARFCAPAEKARADALLGRWGALAILVTRPIPVLAETTALLAGASPMGWGKLLGASAAGAFPASFLYALAGASSHEAASGGAVFGLVLVLAGGVFWFGRRSARG